LDIAQVLVWTKELSSSNVTLADDVPSASRTTILAQAISMCALEAQLVSVVQCIATGGATLERCSQCVTKNGPYMICQYFLLESQSETTNKEEKG